MRLVWSGRSGFAEFAGARSLLKQKPALGFAFEQLAYEDAQGIGHRTLNGAVCALTAAELCAVADWIVRQFDGGWRA